MWIVYTKCLHGGMVTSVAFIKGWGHVMWYPVLLGCGILHYWDGGDGDRVHGQILRDELKL